MSLELECLYIHKLIHMLQLSDFQSLIQSHYTSKKRGNRNVSLVILPLGCQNFTPLDILLPLVFGRINKASHHRPYQQIL